MTSLHNAEYAPHLYVGMDVPHLHAEYASILSAIERCTDKVRLRQWIFNSHKRNAPIVRNAAFQRLAFMSEIGHQDTLENAALRVLAIYRTRLTRHRCFQVKMRKYQDLLESDGAAALLLDLSNRTRFHSISRELVHMDLPELTVEAAIIRFASEFDKTTVATAKEQLLSFGFDGRF